MYSLCIDIVEVVKKVKSYRMSYVQKVFIYLFVGETSSKIIEDNCWIVQVQKVR